jgi:hypothetical protein
LPDYLARFANSQNFNFGRVKQVWEFPESGILMAPNASSLPLPRTIAQVTAHISHVLKL